MIKQENDTLATKLLNSQDAKVAEAARRVFSNSTPIPEHSDEKAILSVTEPRHSALVSSDIQEAASAVIMLAPQHQKTVHLRQTGTSFDVATSPAIPSYDSILASTILGKKATTASERVKRSRERNKMHARKTRQRKKEHMLGLEKRVNDLKAKQIGMKQLINEKATANILLCLAPGSKSIVSSDLDPKVEALIQRPNNDIPDASKIPDLPALVLPGANSKKRKAIQASDGETFLNDSQYPDDGIDYQLLGKDRASCSPEELDKIRRERNRMHAKRTRDRKRIFMERMEEILKALEGENAILEKHLTNITTDSNDSIGRTGVETPSLSSPSLQPCSSSTKSQDLSKTFESISSHPSSTMRSSVVPGFNTDKTAIFNISSSVIPTDAGKTTSSLTVMSSGREGDVKAANPTGAYYAASNITVKEDDIKATTTNPTIAFHAASNTTAISVSDDGASSQSSSHTITSQKRQRLDVGSNVPTSITTNSPKVVSC